MATGFTGIEEKHVTAIAATLMDPRLKKIPFTSDGTVERMKQRIISDASALAASGTEPPTEEAKSVVGTQNPVWKVFEEQAAASRSKNHLTMHFLSWSSILNCQFRQGRRIHSYGENRTQMYFP